MGRAVDVRLNEKAKVPAYLIDLTLGEALDRQHFQETGKEAYKSSAQLCARHSPQDIKGQLVMTVINFPRKQIGSLMSDCLVTGVQAPEGAPEEKRETTVFVKPLFNVPAGSRVGFTGKETPLPAASRDLTWSEFSEVEFHVGTIIHLETTPFDESFHKLSGMASFGYESPFTGFLHKSIDPLSLLSKQFLFWTNPESKIPLLLTCHEGRSPLSPAIKVPDGFKLA